METKIPPPLLLLATGALMWCLYKFGPVAAYESTLLGPIGLAVFLIGLGIGISGAMTFKKVDTTIDPRNPGEASTLVDSGVFGFTRNPMYLSMVLELAGFAIYLGNPLNLILIVLFFGYITRFQIIPEERALHDKFPEAMADYCSRVSALGLSTQSFPFLPAVRRAHPTADFGLLRRRVRNAHRTYCRTKINALATRLLCRRCIHARMVNLNYMPLLQSTKL